MRFMAVGVLVILAAAGWWWWCVTPPVAPFIARATRSACQTGDVRTLAALNLLGVPMGRWASPLIGIAAQNGQLSAMEYLVHIGVEVNQRGKFSTPLELAASAGRVDAVRWLLDHGARTDLAGEELPLVASVQSCQPEIAGLLLDRGAPRLKYPEYDLSIAARRGCPRLDELRAILR
jgi:hypothetical protein